MQRNSARVLAIRALEIGKFFVPAAVLWQSGTYRLEGWAAVAVTVLFWTLLVGRLGSSVCTWWTTRYRVTPDGVRLAAGVLLRTETTTGWGDVAAVRVSQPWAHRLLSVSLVRIETGAQGGALVLDALPDRAVREIETMFRAHRTTHPGDHTVTTPSQTAGPAQPPVSTGTASQRGEVVYAIRPFDLLLISVTYGQFVLLVPAVLGLWAELSRWVSLPMPALTPGPAGPWWALLLVVPVTLAVAVGYGCAVAWLRYRSFRVRLDVAGLEVSGGAVSQERRRVAPAQIRGLRVDQNPLMRVLGHGRLSLLSRESGKREGTRVLFPVAALPRLAEGVETFFPAFSGAVADLRGPDRRVAGLVLAVDGFVLGAAWALISVLRPQLLPAVAVLVIVLLLVTNWLWTAADFDPASSLVRYRRGFLWVRRYAFPVSSVHLATWSRGPVGRRLEVVGVSLFLHDGRRVRLRVVGCPEALAARLVEAVATPPARERRAAVARVLVP